MEIVSAYEPRNFPVRKDVVVSEKPENILDQLLPEFTKSKSKLKAENDQGD